MEIVEVKEKRDLLDFIRLPFFIYNEDPFFSPLPVFEQKKVFLPAKNPFFNYADIKLFLLKDNGRPAGRIASILDKRHLALHKDSTGFFGFYESINNPEAAQLLLERVQKELKAAGMVKMLGPMNFSTNEECGFLCEGFDTPPMIMTPHNPAYYNDLMKSCGMEKAKDLLGFILDLPDRLPDKVTRVADIAERRGLTARHIEMKRLHEEMKAFKEVYNDSWKNNWGFIPIADDELEDMVKRLKGVLLPELTAIAEKDGIPVGFLGMVPDLNQVLRRIKGKLGPLEIIKAIYYSGKVDAVRLMLLGTREEWRIKGVDALLFTKAFSGFAKLRKRKFRQVELSWILEDNFPVIRLAEMMGSRPYKRYRVYGKSI